MIVACLASAGGFVQGQATVYFNTRAMYFPSVVAPVYGLEPDGGNTILQGNATTNGGSIVYSGPLLTGTGYTAALYGGPEETTDPNDLVLVGTTTFREPGILAGHIIPPLTASIVPGVVAGSRAAFQLRAWDNKNGTLTNWAQVRADPTIARGTSMMFVSIPLNLPPSTPATLAGLESFCLHFPQGGLEILTNPHDVTAAPGASAIFSVSVVGAAPLSYQWMFNGAEISGATGSSLTIANAQYPNVGNYLVVLRASGSSVTVTSRVARLVLQPTIVLIEQTTIQPWGVQAIRMTYDSTPNRAVHVEANNSLTGNSWLEVGSASSPVIRGFFFDVFSTNQVRVYRLRLD